MSDLERFKKRVDRERLARKQAEQLLEDKSRELFEVNKKLEHARQDLENRVVARTAELQETNEHLQHEIHTHKETQAKLADARDEALEASRLKSEFLANMSHEIRTPLNAIIGLTNLLMDTELSAEQADFLKTINLSGDSLLTIINDILDFSRIEANRMELETQPFAIRECIEDAIDLLAQKAQSKGLELAYEMKPSVPEAIIGDVTRLRQILVNLLNNAIKFTQFGEVTIHIDAEEAEEGQTLICFAVRDTGIGIPEDRLHRLFNSFSQVDASTTRKFGGTGLGLAISKRLSNLMGGDMWVESTVDVGSTFHFSILTKAVDQDGVTSVHQRVEALAGKRVLIVDDNNTNCLILSKQVESWGMVPTAVNAPEKAIDVIRSRAKFDIGIIDMQMPNIDGIMLAKSLNVELGLALFPMIMLSSIGQRPSEASNLFSSYANKPVKPKALKKSLLIALGEAEAKAQQIDARKEIKLLADAYPLRILLAEDNVVNQKVAINMLKRFGFRADIAGNGLEAIEAVRRQKYDVILMDVQMPEMDGVTATEHLIEEFGMSRPRIIAMTANAMIGDRERFLKAGMDDYISKPVKLPQLEEALIRCIEAVQPASALG